MNGQGMPITYGLNHSLPAGQQDFENLFATIFQSEILAAYQENLLLQPLIRHRSISGAISEKFVKTWKMKAERHARGQEMTPQDMESMEVEIELDKRPLYVAALIDDIDELKAHFSKRQEISQQMGVALAREIDSHVARLIINASRYVKPVGDNSEFPSGGGSLFDTNLNFSFANVVERRDAAGALLGVIDNALVQFESNDVPLEGLNCAIRYPLFSALLTYGIPYGSTDLSNGMTPVFANRDIEGPGFGNLGMLVPRARPLDYRGVKIWSSPSIPSTNITVGEAKYQGDFTNTVGMIWHQDAAATLDLMNVTTEQERKASRGADFMNARFHSGGGTLRPEAAIEILDADPS